MNLKLYIRGLGIGLVVATIILTVAGKVQGNEALEQNLTQPETTTMASYFKTTQAATTVDETVSAKSEATTASLETTVSAETTAGSSIKYEETASGSTPAEVVTQSTTKQSASYTVTATAYLPTSVAVNKTTVSFASISSSEEAAQLLERNGVIEDWRSFNSYLEENGYSRKVSKGTFDLLNGDTFENIAKTITNSR